MERRMKTQKPPDPSGIRDQAVRINVGKHNKSMSILPQPNEKDKEEKAMSEARNEIMEEEEELQEVAVLDDASAEMILKQLKAAEDQYDRMKAWYDHQTKRLKEIRDRTRAWAETCLRPYFDMVPTTGKKILSYDMPGGTLKLAKQDPEYEVNDDELVPWLEANKMADFVKVTKEAKWGDFKETLKDEKKKIRTVAAEDGTLQVVTEDGEIVPGVTAKIREDKFSIKCK